NAAEPALLPGLHEWAGGPGVADPRPRRVEGQPAPRAFRAAANRPRGRGAAAGAQRRTNIAQQPLAAVAEQRSRHAARSAATREEELVQPRRPRYGGNRAESVTKLN